MKIVIPGGSGQVGTVLARAFHRDGHEVVVLSRAPRRRPWRVVRVGRRRRSATGGARLDGCRRRDQPRRPQRQLPLHRREPTGDPRIRACCRRARSAQAIARSRASAARLAAGEHRHHLRAPLRPPQRRGYGHDRRRRSRRARHRGGSASTSPARGSVRSTRR